VSAATGHTLVHYLYTGTYQTLGVKVENAVAPAHIKLKQALLTFVLASAYGIQDLERLAKEQIEIYGGRMSFVQVLDFSKMTRCWFHEYLQARVDDQFDLDFTVFKSKVFIESVGEGTLHRFMTSHLLKRFSEKLAHTLQSRGSRCLDKEKLDVVLDDVEDAAVQTHHCLCDHREHQPDICTANDEKSFEFSNVPHEEVYDVISLESSVCDETPPAHPEPEPLPLAEPEPEPVPEPEPEPEPVVLEPEPEPEPAVDPFAGLGKSQKKKLQDKMKKEEDAKRKEEEEAAEKIRQTEEAEAERVAREAEEAAAAEKQRIAAEEAEAEAAQIAAEEEAARIAEEEAARKKKEEEKEEERASKSTERAASIWGSSKKKKESTKDRKAREEREKEQEENERLAREEADRLDAEEEARIEAEAAEAA
jgi:hypothetical protein